MEQLKVFMKTPINSDMINVLVNTTQSIIPTSQENKNKNSLYQFIKKLIKYSNVQTPTLMSTLVYLTKLKNILPNNIRGCESTCHRLFLGVLIIASKTLNDSSPLNRHWCKYTDGLLSLPEINLIELEIIKYLDWNLDITENDLSIVLSYFLTPIQSELHHKEMLMRSEISSYSIPSLVSSNSIMSSSSSMSSVSSRKPLSNISINKLTIKPEITKPKYHFSDEQNPFQSPTNKISIAINNNSFNTISELKEDHSFKCRPLRLSKISGADRKMKGISLINVVV